MVRSGIARTILIAAFMGATVAGFTLPARGDDAWTLSGEVTGLYPGHPMTLEVRVANPSDSTMHVTSIDTIVASTTVGCAASQLTVNRFDGDIAVPATSTVTVPVRVLLATEAPGACIGATFDLRFTGTATGPTPADPASAPLARTGLDPGPLTAFGFGLVALGLVALTVVGARRRSRVRVP
jgi:hypothetical protein